MRRVQALVAATAVLVGLFIALLAVVNARDPGLPRLEISFSLLQRAGGVLLVGVGALMILVKTLLGEGAADVAVLALPVLAGALLLSPHWATALALATLSAAAIWGDWWPRRPAPPPV